MANQVNPSTQKSLNNAGDKDKQRRHPQALKNRDQVDEHDQARAATKAEICVGNLVDAFEVLLTLQKQPLDGISATKVLKLAAWARPHYLNFCAERTKLFEKFGEKTSETQFKVKTESIDELNKALLQVRAPTVPGLDSALLIAVDKLGDIKISPQDLNALRPFLSGLDE